MNDFGRGRSWRIRRSPRRRSVLGQIATSNKLRGLSATTRHPSHSERTARTPAPHSRRTLAFRGRSKKPEKENSFVYVGYICPAYMRATCGKLRGPYAPLQGVRRSAAHLPATASSSVDGAIASAGISKIASGGLIARPESSRLHGCRDGAEMKIILFSVNSDKNR